MAKSDYYEILGVSRTATDDELKKAFRALARKYHPDMNKDDKTAEAKFKEVGEAYEVLSNPEKRAAYDRFGHDAFEGGMGARRGGGGSAGGFSDFGFAGAFSDIFEEMFGDMGAAAGGGGTRRASSATRGADLRFNLDITLNDAFAGATKTIKVPSFVTCATCHGSGGENGAQPVTCPKCQGSGRLRAQQGFFMVERTCDGCGGTGSIIKDPCRTCGGGGRVRREKTLEVKIPAGVDEGTRIRLAGEGEAGMRGGPTGDLYVFLSIKPHKLFVREGADLACKIPITYVQAALGAVIDAPTIDGTLTKVTIPPGIQAGQKLRLKSKGMSVLRRPDRGDMYIEIQVETPVNLTKKQQELLKEFEAAGGKNRKSHNPESESFFAKVKDLWSELKE